MLPIFIAIAVSLVAFAGLAAAILGLPGTWLMVVAAVVVALTTDPETFVHVSWPGVLALTVLAAAGEWIEFIAGSAGVGKMGGSRRASWFALAGSLIGAVTGLFVGIPVPIIGSLISSVLLGGLGAAAGAIIGERTEGKSWRDSSKVGAAAAVGRLLGTVGKSACAAIIFVVLVWQLWL